MAITLIDDPPFIQRLDPQGWEYKDTGKRSFGLAKGYNTNELEAHKLGFKTINGANISLQTVNRHIIATGSVMKRGSKSNQIKLFLASGGTAFGTFVYFFFDAWGY